MVQENRFKLIDIISTLLEIDAEKVSDETSPETITQWDSLNHVNICTAVSEEFSISMTVEEMTSIRNFGDLAKLLISKGVSCS